MIQPGGAMALFVLRLAGLLSLEKSLEENSTSTFLTNETNQFLFNLTNTPSLSQNESYLKDLHQNENDNVEFKISTPKYSFFTSERENDTLLLYKNNSLADVMNEKSINNKDFQNITGRANDSSILIVQNSSNTNTSKEKINIGTHLLEDKIKTTEIPKVFKQNIVAVIPSTTSVPLPPRSSETGFSPVITQNINNTATPPFFVNSKPSVPKLSLTYNNFAPINESNFQELEAHSSNFVTKDFEYYDSKDLNYNSSDYVPNLNYNSSDFVPNLNYNSSNFDPNLNYNSSNFVPNLNYNSSDYVPDLTSHSLVSPVPQFGHEELNLEYFETKENNEEEIKTSVTVTNMTTDVQGSGQEDNVTDSNYLMSLKVKSDFHLKLMSNETLKKRGIGPVFPLAKTTTPIQVRNNPYPYGPKVLPEYSLPYKPNSKSEDVSHEFEDFYPDKDIYYDYSEEEKEKERRKLEEETKEDNGSDKKERRREDVFFVKTEKPTVLFHFEPPGYSPKLPESSLPPTRAPTPSDPWDCSPRCPRYSLLDWNQDYDIRQYPVTTWISTVIIAENRILAELEGYMKVQDYFYGLNDRGQLLNVTVPFVTQIKHGRHPGVLNELTDFTVSLYVNQIDDPLNYNLPTPISNEVLIDRLETKTVFVSGFETNVWEVTEQFLHEKASELMNKLRQNGEAFLDRYFYLASYSRPELYQPVYYELWIYGTAFRSNPAATSPLAPRTRPPPNKITAKSISKLCRGVECPAFEVLRTYRYGIQKRRYFDGLFAITSPGVCEFTTLSVWKGFMPLHLYKHGINSHMEVIEATRPIGLVHVKEDSTSTTECPQNLTMAIYLPKRLHSNPPLTGYDAPSVTISALQDVVVYAYTVGGYLLEPNRVRKELADLKHRLTEFGACFKNDEYYVVVYDFIIRYHGRQNEIWVVAENCKATLNG